MTFEEALADLIADYDEVSRKERATLLRQAARRLHSHADDDEKPIMDRWR